MRIHPSIHGQFWKVTEDSEEFCLSVDVVVVVSGDNYAVADIYGKSE